MKVLELFEISNKSRFIQIRINLQSVSKAIFIRSDSSNDHYIL